MIGPKFDRAKQLSEGLAVVNVGGTQDMAGIFSGGKWGFIDKKGILVIPLKFGFVSRFNKGLSIVNRPNIAFHSSEFKYGYINKHGKLIIGYKYDRLDIFKNGLALVNRKNEYSTPTQDSSGLAYIDRHDRIIFEFPSKNE